jgi:hypothetical protein
MENRRDVSLNSITKEIIGELEKQVAIKFSFNRFEGLRLLEGVFRIRCLTARTAGWEVSASWYS